MLLLFIFCYTDRKSRELVYSTRSSVLPSSSDKKLNSEMFLAARVDKLWVSRQYIWSEKWILIIFRKNFRIDAHPSAKLKKIRNFRASSIHLNNLTLVDLKKLDKAVEHSSRRIFVRIYSLDSRIKFIQPDKPISRIRLIINSSIMV